MEICRQSDNVWTLCISGTYFRMNTLTKMIVECIDAGFTNEEIRKKLLENKYEAVLNVDIDALRNVIAKIPLQRKKQKIIWGNLTILNLSKWKKFLCRLSFLFNPVVVFSVLVLFAILFMSQYESIINVSRLEVLGGVKNEPYILFVYMIISFVIVLIHEFGHAVAALKFKVPPKEIGFGFYLYFPVFYTDVSNAWLASKRHRIVIDVSGYYFQIISMVILLAMSVVFNIPKGILQLLIWDNVFIILYNLNPLFRFDGYWLLSDLLDIPNLGQKSAMAFPELLLAIIGRRKLSNSFSPAVYVYSVISNVFIVTMVCLFAVFAVKNIVEVPVNLGMSAILFWCVRMALLLLACYFSFRAVFFLIKNIVFNVLQLLREGKPNNA